MKLHGRSLIEATFTLPGDRGFHAIDPATGERLLPEYQVATPGYVDRAAQAAANVATSFGHTTGSVRARLLRHIADEITGLGDDLLNRYIQETGLSRERAEAERTRTCAQLRMFADLVATEAWADPRFDRPDPARQPHPRPEMRSLLRPIGPVVVFGPANFPLAFSVAGGDTASALAAGCPVIVKAHSSHPGTSELVGRAIVNAVGSCDLPAGVFSLLFGDGRTVGRALVQHPAVRGVGFTGSRRAGQALHQLCALRDSPIPFFGELSSINPVCLLPEALDLRAESIADRLAVSLTGGCGQLCTKPGLVLYVRSPAAERFVARLQERLAAVPPAPMLNASTQVDYRAGLTRVAHTEGVEVLLDAPQTTGFAEASPALFRCAGQSFPAQPSLHEEIFGPATLLVACADSAELLRSVEALGGQLTGTVHQSGGDLAGSVELLLALETRCGRLVFDGFPTGVEVGSATVHSGPWPATTDSRFTSVGSGEIRRWVRPICWQNAPVSALPYPLRQLEA